MSYSHAQEETILAPGSSPANAILIPDEEPEQVAQIPDFNYFFTEGHPPDSILSYECPEMENEIILPETPRTILCREDFADLGIVSQSPVTLAGPPTKKRRRSYSWMIPENNTPRSYAPERTKKAPRGRKTEQLRHDIGKTTTLSETPKTPVIAPAKQAAAQTSFCGNHVPKASKSDVKQKRRAESPPKARTPETAFLKNNLDLRLRLAAPPKKLTANVLKGGVSAEVAVETGLAHPVEAGPSTHNPAISIGFSSPNSIHLPSPDMPLSFHMRQMQVQRKIAASGRWNSKEILKNKDRGPITAIEGEEKLMERRNEIRVAGLFFPGKVSERENVIEKSHNPQQPDVPPGIIFVNINDGLFQADVPDSGEDPLADSVYEAAHKRMMEIDIAEDYRHYEAAAKNESEYAKLIEKFGEAVNQAKEAPKKAAGEVDWYERQFAHLCGFRDRAFLQKVAEEERPRLRSKRRREG